MGRTLKGASMMFHVKHLAMRAVQVVCSVPTGSASLHRGTYRPLSIILHHATISVKSFFALYVSKNKRFSMYAPYISLP